MNQPNIVEDERAAPVVSRWLTLDKTELYSSGFEDTTPTLYWDGIMGEFTVRGKLFLQQFGDHPLYRIGFTGKLSSTKDEEDCVVINNEDGGEESDGSNDNKISDLGRKGTGYLHLPMENEWTVKVGERFNAKHYRNESVISVRFRNRMERECGIKCVQITIPDSDDYEEALAEKLVIARDQVNEVLDHTTS